ncbi:hypothetical protein ACFFUB_09775 [Algimonas porphyrae]|uniref:Uncharacterized protein n=1 Tax=Algimonas porphyrae TaxID=1128113 RepID=A0ABQ5V5P2_9PROT|nr:hypothetical protein [Algimonas porphyrae]GLQ21592.1 hypothetical protein GCM10007854_25470 [Algimonas porphyrae]
MIRLLISSRPVMMRNIILFMTALSLWTTWLPMMRTLSGQNSYAWGVEWFNTMYRGVGWEGDWLFLVYQAILGVTILWMGFRNPKAPFAALLIVWHALPFANALYLPLIADKRNIFYGDTGGVQWDLTWVSPLVTGCAFALVFLWAVSGGVRADRHDPVSWTRQNTQFAFIFGLYLVVVTGLEWTGPVHGLTDMFAVPLNILAPVLIALMLYPWISRSKAGEHAIV